MPGTQGYVDPTGSRRKVNVDKILLCATAEWNLWRQRGGGDPGRLWRAGSTRAARFLDQLKRPFRQKPEPPTAAFLPQVCGDFPSLRSTNVIRLQPKASSLIAANILPNRLSPSARFRQLNFSKSRLHRFAFGVGA